MAKTPPPQPGKVSTWRWDGTRWVPVAASVRTGAGTVDQTKVVYWTPRPPWRWDGRQWTFNARDLSRIAAATTVMPTSLPATPPPPEESGDGNFYWDGKTWLPIVRSEPAVIRFGSAAAIARDLPMGAALARIPKWLIPLLPLIVGVVGWAFGQLWLTWLAIPLAVVAVLVLAWSEAGVPLERSTPAASPSPPRAESSISACVGLAVGDWGEVAELVQAIAPLGEVLGEAGGLKVVRWQDPSGTRLVMETIGDDDPDLVPSFAARTRVRLRGVQMLNDDVAMATVVDDEGQALTSVAVLIEQRRLIPWDQPIDGVASIVALGTSVSIHESPDDFGESDASLFLGWKDAEQWRLHPDEPPAEYVREGLKWPRRMAGESFGSYAVFLKPDQAGSSALLSGTILAAERRTVIQTGQQILVAEVRTAGFDVTVCLEGAAHKEMPPVGGILSGSVLMVASLDTWQVRAGGGQGPAN